MKHIFTLILFLLIYGCGTVKPPQIVKKSALDKYKYVYIPQIQSINSTTGIPFLGMTIPYSKSTSPRDIIAGYFLKKGYTLLAEIDSDKKDSTIIVNYGESGRRPIFLGYVLEITIQITSASTAEVLSVVTAEGLGETEADDTRKAITKALKALFEEKREVDSEDDF